TSCQEHGGIGGFDLTQNLQPPKSLYIEARCLVDYGEFETDDGSIINLSRGSHHLLSQTDAEDLIKQGILEHVCS
ncbi:DNA replication complex GINS protein PSF1, partial [Cichlidogyrus casuarinus]